MRLASQLHLYSCLLLNSSSSSILTTLSTKLVLSPTLHLASCSLDSLAKEAKSIFGRRSGLHRAVSPLRAARPPPPASGPTTEADVELPRHSAGVRARILEPCRCCGRCGAGVPARIATSVGEPQAAQGRYSRRRSRRSESSPCGEALETRESSSCFRIRRQLQSLPASLAQ